VGRWDLWGQCVELPLIFGKGVSASSPRLDPGPVGRGTCKRSDVRLTSFTGSNRLYFLPFLMSLRADGFTKPD